MASTAALTITSISAKPASPSRGRSLRSRRRRFTIAWSIDRRRGRVERSGRTSVGGTLKSRWSAGACSSSWPCSWASRRWPRASPRATAASAGADDGTGAPAAPRRPGRRRPSSSPPRRGPRTTRWTRRCRRRRAPRRRGARRPRPDPAPAGGRRRATTTVVLDGLDEMDGIAPESPATLRLYIDRAGALRRSRCWTRVAGSARSSSASDRQPRRRPARRAPGMKRPVPSHHGQATRAALAALRSEITSPLPRQAVQRPRSSSLPSGRHGPRR